MIVHSQGSIYIFLKLERGIFHTPTCYSVYIRRPIKEKHEPILNEILGYAAY